MDAEMGPLIFASASHCEEKARKGKRKRKQKKRQCEFDNLGVRDLPLSKRVKGVHHLTDTNVGGHFNITEPQAMKAGDATIHMGWTLHRAPPNTSPTRRTRRAIAISYFADPSYLYPDLFSNLPGAQGLPLMADNGGSLTVQLIADDFGTWLPWVLEKQIHPAKPVATTYTPLVFPTATA